MSVCRIAHPSSTAVTTLTWLLEEQGESFIVGVGPDALGPLRKVVALRGGVHVQVHAGHVVLMVRVHLLCSNIHVHPIS